MAEPDPPIAPPAESRSPPPIAPPTESRIPPPVIPLVVVAAGAVLHWQYPLRWSVDAMTPGIFLVLLALSLIAWAVFTLTQAGTTPEPWHETKAIVGRGPYRYSRNPIYVGFLLAQAGLAMALGWWWVLLLVPVSWLGLDRLIVRREEAHLRARFGKRYADYCDQVRRWI